MIKQVNTPQRPVDWVIKTESAAQTLDFGRILGTLLEAGDIIALVGNLGAGKTWLAKGIAFSLGVPEHEYVNSPAYDLIHEYIGRLPVYHMDFYRIEGFTDEDVLWLAEYVDDQGVCIIEWANKFIDQITDSYLQVELVPGNADYERTLQLTGIGSRYEELVAQLQLRKEFAQK